MIKNLKIRIGDVSISIEGEAQKASWEILPAYGPFIGPGKTDITLRLHQGAPDSPVGEKLFDSPPIWSLYRQNGTSIIKIFDNPMFSGLERTLKLSPELEKADLYLTEKSGRFLDPFYGPTMELLMMHYLAKERGVIIHSCGIANNGRGMLFVGESGAGKSTLAGMWDRENGVEVLSDDRTVVRRKGQEFWMYGTPWHGDAKLASPQGVRLERVFFLRHAPKNSIRKVKGADSVSKLLTCSFPPHWDAQGMTFTLELLADLAAHLPCQELAFRPQKGALEFIKKLGKQA